MYLIIGVHALENRYSGGNHTFMFKTFNATYYKNYFEIAKKTRKALDLNSLGSKFTFDILDTETEKVFTNVTNLNKYADWLMGYIDLPDNEKDMVLINSNRYFWKFLELVNNPPRQISKDIQFALESNYISIPLSINRDFKVHWNKDDAMKGIGDYSILAGKFIKENNISGYISYNSSNKELGDLQFSKIDDIGLFYRISDKRYRSEYTAYEFTNLLELYRIFVLPFAEIIMQNNLQYVVTPNNYMLEVNNKLLSFLTKYSIVMKG
jgi:hypothetical protein